MGEVRADVPDWLPELVLFEDYDGSWPRYEEALYDCFETDFLKGGPFFRGIEVKFKRHPMLQEKVATFWHIISEGLIEEERLPDMRRCERIRWPRALIENSEDAGIKIWENENRGEKRVCLWLEQQEYLVVLGFRGVNYVLWTAYCVTEQHRKKKLQREYEIYHMDNAAP